MWPLSLLVFISFILNRSCGDEVTVEEAANLNTNAQDSSSTPGFPGPHPNLEMIHVWLEPSVQLISLKDTLYLPAGKRSRLAIFVSNNAQIKSDTKLDFVVVNADLRYPPQPTYVVQNLTSTYVRTSLEPRQQSTISYEFVPSTQLGGQPFILTILLALQDGTGKFFVHPVINETVHIYELEEEPHKNYLSLGFIILVLVSCFTLLFYHLASSKTRSFISSRSTGESIVSSSKNEYIELMNKAKTGGRSANKQDKYARQ